MSLKYLKPHTPGQRGGVLLERSYYKSLFPKKFTKHLRQGKKNMAGRNHQGKITLRHRGGGHKRSYRQVIFKRQEKLGTFRVYRLDYDPNRRSGLALLGPWKEKILIENLQHEKPQNFFYILAPKGLQIGDTVKTLTPKENRNVDSKTPGYAMPLEMMLVGTIVHNIAPTKEKPGIYARAAGSYGQLIEKDYSRHQGRLRLPSGEELWVSLDAYGTQGRVGREEKIHCNLGKAGRSRWLSRRPKVRGVAMNPVDHPHGGGEGKTSGGRPSVRPWGRLTKGWKTGFKK